MLAVDLRDSLFEVQMVTNTMYFLNLRGFELKVGRLVSGSILKISSLSTKISEFNEY